MTISLCLNPTKTDAYILHGAALLHLRRYEEAGEAFTRHLNFRPQEAEAYRNRAYVNLYLSRGEAAAADAQAYLQISGGQNFLAPYARLVAYFGNLQAGNRVEAEKGLGEAVSEGNISAWPFPVVRYLRGELRADELLAQAVDGDKETEANAYIGLHLSLSGRNEEAVPYFRWVKENGNRSFVEYWLADAELAHLGHNQTSCLSASTTSCR